MKPIAEPLQLTFRYIDEKILAWVGSESTIDQLVYVCHNLYYGSLIIVLHDSGDKPTMKFEKWKASVPGGVRTHALLDGRNCNFVILW